MLFHGGVMEPVGSTPKQCSRPNSNITPLVWHRPRASLIENGEMWHGLLNIFCSHSTFTDQHWVTLLWDSVSSGVFLRTDTTANSSFFFHICAHSWLLFCSWQYKKKRDMFGIWKGLAGLSACWCLLMLIHCLPQTGKEIDFTVTAFPFSCFFFSFFFFFNERCNNLILCIGT